MKYSLSFCEISQVSDDIFETIDNEGVMIDNKCAVESWNFWDELRKEPFGLLVNCKNSFAFSFEGAREIGNHPLQQKTAILVNNIKQKLAMELTVTIKESVKKTYNHKIFHDRKDAIVWLNDLT